MSDANSVRESLIAKSGLTADELSTVVRRRFAATLLSKMAKVLAERKVELAKHAGRAAAAVEQVRWE